MTIDIIDITLPEYADLSAVQLSMVRAAQAKKDKLTAEAAERKTQIFYLALGNNTARSSALKCEREEIDEKLNKDVTAVREDLIHQLAYESLGSEGNDKGPYRYPENPNYNLTDSQRFLVVRAYYMGVTSDADARLQAFAMDSLARSYLGEYYQTLYDLLASYC